MVVVALAKSSPALRTVNGKPRRSRDKATCQLLGDGMRMIQTSFALFCSHEPSINVHCNNFLHVQGLGHQGSTNAGVNTATEQHLANCHNFPSWKTRTKTFLSPTVDRISAIALSSLFSMVNPPQERINDAVETRLSNLDTQPHQTKSSSAFGSH